MTGTDMRRVLRGVARLIVAPMLTVALVTGCTTTADVASAPLTQGTVIKVDAPFTDTVSATVDGLHDMGLAVKSTEARPEGVVVMMGQPMHAFSWGIVGRVFIERATAPPFTLHVIWEKRAQFQFAGSSEAKIARKLKTSIQRVLNRQRKVAG